MDSSTNENSNNEHSSPTFITQISASDNPSQLAASVVSKSKIGRNGLEKYYKDIREYLTGENKGKTSAVCSLCDDTVWHMKNVTSNYSRHLQRKHKKEFEAWVISIKSMKNVGTEMKQSTLEDIISSPRSSKYASSHPRQIELTEMVFHNFLIELTLPLSIVENPSFLRAMKMVDPRFCVPSRRMFTETYLPKVYDRVISKLRDICSSASFLSLSFDAWSDRRMRAYYAVTIHFINRMGAYKSHLLAFNPLSGESLF